MSKDPAFLFYPGDWLGGTQRLTRKQRGAYVDLLVAQFNGGHMTSLDIGHVLGQDFEKLWDKNLKCKFEIDSSGNYFNKRLEEEQIKRANFVKSRKNNIKGINQHTSKHMTSHKENENEDVNKDKDIKESKEDFYKSFKYKAYKCFEKNPGCYSSANQEDCNYCRDNRKKWSGVKKGAK